MSTIPIIDLVAGMIFIYFLMSIVCSSVFEIISAWLQIRSTMMEEWIQKNFPQLKYHFLDHSISNGVSEKGKSSSYIDKSNFYLSLIDAISIYSKKVPETLQDIKATLIDLETKAESVQVLNKDFSRSIRFIISEIEEASKIPGQAKSELEEFRKKVENWFDTMMERVSGSYKRKSGYYTAAIAVVTTLVLNVDSITLANYLYSNENARNQLAMAAYDAIKDSTTIEKVKEIKAGKTDTIKSVDQAVNKSKTNFSQSQANIAKIGSYIPIGWNMRMEYKVFLARRGEVEGTIIDVIVFFFTKLFGLAITIFAVSLGAPFWFDILGKLANLRNSLKPVSKPDIK